MALWPTEMDVAYHWPFQFTTEPGRVSMRLTSWFTWVPEACSEFRTSSAFTNAWRWMAVWRSLRKLCRAVK